MTKDLTTKEQYAIMAPDTDVVEVINLNLGGEALSISDLNHIKTPVGGSSTWSLPSIDGDEKSVKDFEAIIVHSQIQRTYWKEAFSGGGTPPDCFSNDAIIGVGDPGGKCETCPNNEFGTSLTGRGKACQTKRIMFLVQPGSLLPTMLRVPVGSLKNSRKYLSQLASESKRVYSVVTRFGLEKDKNKDNIQFSKITFTRVGSVDDITAVEKYVEAIMPYIQQATRSIDPGYNDAS
jgi:hypothetical protein